MQNRLLRFPVGIIGMALMLLFFTVPAFAASGDKTISYDFYFESDRPDVLSYTPKNEEIEIDGKHYRLKDVSCELYSEPLKEKKSVKSKDKKADPYITKYVEGTEIKLYAPAEIKWKDNSVKYTQEYRAENDAPNTITVEEKELALRSIDPISRTDNVSTIAKFYSDDPDEDEYTFNGKTVVLYGSEPKWDGWADDYAEYLGIENNSNYSITGTKWNGKARRHGDGYVRYATVYGKKNVSYVIATYGLADDSSRYTADVTYTSKYIGHATVTYERYFTTLQKLIYAGVGIGILVLLITAILFLLKRRRKEEDETENILV